MVARVFWVVARCFFNDSTHVFINERPCSAHLALSQSDVSVVTDDLLKERKSLEGFLVRVSH